MMMLKPRSDGDVVKQGRQQCAREQVRTHECECSSKQRLRMPNKRQLLIRHSRMQMPAPVQNDGEGVDEGSVGAIAAGRLVVIDLMEPNDQ